MTGRIDTPTTTVYRCGPLIDLCRGPHVRHTGKIKVCLSLPRTEWCPCTCLPCPCLSCPCLSCTCLPALSCVAYLCNWHLVRALLPLDGQALAVLKTSSTYWEGKSDCETLRRVYGISFPDPKQLKVRVRC